MCAIGVTKASQQRINLARLSTSKKKLGKTITVENFTDTAPEFKGNWDQVYEMVRKIMKTKEVKKRERQRICIERT